MPKVFVTNKSAHDFSRAKHFGKLVYITEGIIRRFNTNDMHRRATEAFKQSTKDDYILPCSLYTLNMIVCSAFAVQHGRLNLLLYNGESGSYLERVVVF